MRYLVIAVMAFFVLSSALYAVDIKSTKNTKSAAMKSVEKKMNVKKTAGNKTIAVVTDSGKGPKVIDTNYGGGKPERTDYGVEQDRAMPSGQTYDRNTGLPNVVESDSAYNLE